MNPSKILFIIILSLLFGAYTLCASIGEKVFSVIDSRHGLSDNQVLHILQLPDGRMAVSTVGNINIYDGARFSYVHYDTDSRYTLPGYEGHRHVYVGEGNLLWSKSRRGLQCFNLASDSYISDIDSVLNAAGADRQPLDLFVDKEGCLWTVSDKGILDTRHKRRYRLLPGALQDLETEGDTLMLFYSTGVMEGFDRASGRRIWHTAAYPDSTSYTFTSLVRITPDGQVLQVRVSKSGESVLMRFDTRTLRWKVLLQTPYVLHTLSQPTADEAYIASMKGIWHIDLNTSETRLITRLTGITSDISVEGGLNTLYMDRASGCWIGTYRDGLLYSPPEPTRILSRESLGLLGIDSLKIRKVTLRGGKSLIDKEGRQWTATVDGLRIQDSGNGLDTTLYTENGLSNNCIKSLAIDSDGAIWASTANGMNAIYTTGNNEFIIDSYGSDMGALPGEYREGASFISSDGRLLFAHPKGWTMVNPISSDKLKELPASLVRQITVNGMPVSFTPGKRLDFDYDKNDIAISYASLNYANPQSTKWQYRILQTGSGKDVPWHTYDREGGGFHFTMPQVMPGNYLVQVRSAERDGAPFGTPVEIAFFIRKPWWWSGWAIAAYILILLCLCSIGWMIYRRIEIKRIEKIHNEEKMLLRMKELIERCNYYEEKIKSNAKKGDMEAHSEDNETSEDGQSECVAPQKAGMSQEDKDFIAQAINLVEMNMDNGYSVKRLSSDLCMERTGLYKRITALLDKSPSVFIRSVRLNHATRLIEEGKLPMNEIAELTGFSSSSHMSRCFKEEHGCTPTEYVRNLGK